MQYNNLHLNYPILIIDEDRIVNHSKTPLVAQPYFITTIKASAAKLKVIILKF